MNCSRRKSLREAVCLIEKAVSIIESVSESEQDALDNIPENFQSGDRAGRMEEVVELMDSSAESLESVKSDLESILS